jgi:hypothetical protein
MALVTRRIGLSLGADICWPLCFEGIMKRLDLQLKVGSDTVRVEVDRVTIEPFNLRQGCKYDVVLDRLTHWYHTSREWIKKATIMDGLYVFNNPWSLQSQEKHSTYCAMMKLGFQVPDTWMVPPKAYDPLPDLQPTLERYARLFDLAEVGERLGYPLFMKPYDGGGWIGVSRIESASALKAAYEQSGKRVMHLQKSIEGFDLFVRCIGIGPQVRLVKYDAAAPLHDRYRMDRDFVSAEERRVLEDTAMTINGFFGWDFNSAEVLRKDGVFSPIDFANACPDSQVTSLHYHFPWIVKALVRWGVFCAVTKRRFRHNLDWSPYYQAQEETSDQPERLRRYAAIARRHFEAERFQEFCAEHLHHLDAVAYDFFASDDCREAVRQKVRALYPAHEVDSFTDLFFSRIQKWREQEPPSS